MLTTCVLIMLLKFNSGGIFNENVILSQGADSSVKINESTYEVSGFGKTCTIYNVGFTIDINEIVLDDQTWNAVEACFNNK